MANYDAGTSNRILTSASLNVRTHMHVIRSTRASLNLRPQILKQARDGSLMHMYDLAAKGKDMPTSLHAVAYDVACTH